MSKLHPLNITKITKKGYKKSHEKFRNLSKEEKEKKLRYLREPYKNLSEDEKQLSIEKNIEYGKIEILWT